MAWWEGFSEKTFLRFFLVMFNFFLFTFQPWFQHAFQVLPWVLLSIVLRRIQSSRLGKDFFKEIPKPTILKRNFPVAKRSSVQSQNFINQTQARDIGNQIRPNLAVLSPSEIKEFFINEFEQAYSAAHQSPAPTSSSNTQFAQPPNIVIHYHVNYHSGKRRRIQLQPQETNPERMSRGQKRRYYKRLAKEIKQSETL